MSRIKPFRAYRPRPDHAERIASPPYDVVSSDEARKMAAGNPLSFLHVGSDFGTGGWRSGSGARAGA